MKTNSKMLQNAIFGVSLAHSRYGTPQPQMTLRFPPKTHYRVVRAALFTLAGKIETATPPSENWCVEVDDDCAEVSGRVYLELVDGSEAESQRGLALLQKVLMEHML